MKTSNTKQQTSNKQKIQNSNPKRGAFINKFLNVLNLMFVICLWFVVCRLEFNHA